MKDAGHCRIWSLSSDSNEYERYERLLEGANKHHLRVEDVNKVLLERGEANLHGSKTVLIIHDPSDLRKPYSEQLEGLEKVKSLEGKWINGYHSFNSVGIGWDKRVHLLGCLPYSKQLDADWKTKRTEQMRQISRAFQQADAEQVRIHVLDREFDDQDCFKLIDKELEDRFVVRLKMNRNASLQKWDDKKQKQVSLKLKEAPFAHHFEQVFAKFSWGKRVYHQVRAYFEYDHYHVGDDMYGLVRVTLRTNSGRLIFKHPMLLATNYKLTCEEIALFVFRTYLSRAKIEGVFKFLKTYLGWETFQVRNFLAIQHLIVLCFFIGGYFYEIQDELTDNEWMKQICLLGGGKGKVSKVFFLQGLQKLANYMEIKQFMQENNLTEDQLQALFNQSD